MNIGLCQRQFVNPNADFSPRFIKKKNDEKLILKTLIIRDKKYGSKVF
jgi:hypothetical protein